jgi:hypothetical protein
LASQFCQTVGDNLFFSPPHIDLRVGKLHLLPNKKCKTVGVALRGSHRGVVPPLPPPMPKHLARSLAPTQTNSPAGAGRRWHLAAPRASSGRWQQSAGDGVNVVGGYHGDSGSIFLIYDWLEKRLMLICCERKTPLFC